MLNLLSVNHISKSYGINKILNDVSISFHSGEIHAVLGENASGKSTLVKIISGMIKADNGEITFNGDNFDSHSRKLVKMETVYQEVNLLDNLTVAENLYLRNESFILNYKKIEKQYEKDAKYLNLNSDAAAIVDQLSLGQKRLIEITKAIISKPEILILDEPTESITQVESERLINVIQEFKKLGTIIILITHKPEQVLNVCDKVTILHDGEVVTTIETKQTDELALLKMMTGKEFKNRYPKVHRNKGEPVLRVEHLGNNRISDVSFTLYNQEILGITGLVGSGKSTLGEMICGLVAYNKGKVFLKHKEMKTISPAKMLKGGCGFLLEGGIQNLIPYFSSPQNITLSNLQRVSKFRIIQFAMENRIFKLFFKKFSMTVPYLTIPVKFLSGGTQQKIALSKLLHTNVDILIVDEPTKGLDSASKSDVYNFMNDFVSKDRSIIIISSDFAEVSGMCDRVIVLNEGKISYVFNHEELSKSKLIMAILKPSNKIDD